MPILGDQKAGHHGQLFSCGIFCNTILWYPSSGGHTQARNIFPSRAHYMHDHDQGSAIGCALQMVWQVTFGLSQSTYT